MFNKKGQVIDGLCWAASVATICNYRNGTNIDNKYPVYASAKPNEGSGHAVTAYGYTVAAGVNYVVFWNSGNEKSITVEFKKGGTSFSYNSTTFIWKYSVCKYY